MSPPFPPFPPFASVIGQSDAPAFISTADSTLLLLSFRSNRAGSKTPTWPLPVHVREMPYSWGWFQAILRLSVKFHLLPTMGTSLEKWPQTLYIEASLIVPHSADSSVSCARCQRGTNESEEEEVLLAGSDNFPPLSSPPCDCWPTLRPFGDRQVPLSLITDTVHSFPGYGGNPSLSLSLSLSLSERSAREGGTLQQQEGSYFFCHQHSPPPPHAIKAPLTVTSLQEHTFPGTNILKIWPPLAG